MMKSVPTEIVMCTKKMDLQGQTRYEFCCTLRRAKQRNNCLLWSLTGWYAGR